MATVLSCPSCAATVREGDPWCTLCWTDLRPKPEPPPPPAPVAPAAVAPAPPVAPAAVAPAPPVAPAVTNGSPVSTVDPLTAPLAAVLAGPLAADPDAPLPTWPCVACGDRNHIDLNACGTCGAPFGGHIARNADPKGTKRRMLVLSFAGVGLFLLLLAAITLMGTKVPKTPADNGVPGTGQQNSGQTSNQGPVVGDGTIVG
jgi:hypothetical protein